MTYKKGQSFRFKEKLVKEGYPPDVLYYVGSFTNEKNQKFLVLDGAGEDVVLVSEADVTPVEESEHQEMMNVLVDIAQILKLMYHRDMTAALPDMDELEMPEDPTPKKKLKPDDWN